MQELQYGWHAAVINSAEELELIKKNRNNDLFIGGTTNLNSGTVISNFEDYLANSSGVVHFYFIWLNRIDPL